MGYSDRTNESFVRSEDREETPTDTDRTFWRLALSGSDEPETRFAKSMERDLVTSVAHGVVRQDTMTEG